MPLPAYGLLIGTPVASRAQTGGHPHWLMMVKPALAGHPLYRVAVNLASSDPTEPPEIEYQIIDVAKGGSQQLRALVDTLTKRGATDSFVIDSGLTLDYVRDGLCAAEAFTKVIHGADPLSSEFQKALEAAIESDEQPGSLVAVFGTGYPVNKRTRVSPSTGYTGVDNIHMNQGSPNITGGGDHYLENGPNQDGGIIFLLPTGAKAFFVKFQSQTLDTNAQGNPQTTPHAMLNERLPRIRQILEASYREDIAAGASRVEAFAPELRVASPAGTQPATALIADAGALAGPAGAAPLGSYVFADPDPGDATGTFLPDEDNGTYNTPYVISFSKGKARGPVPAPRSLDPMRLETIVGNDVPGHSRNDDGSETIIFDMIGDSGATTASKDVGEKAVGDMLAQHSRDQRPAFCFHVGDVVYFYGEKQFYYGQFADVFRDYPAPIFAIPGNHDGITYDESMVSLDAFQQAFCSKRPSHWDGFGGITRTTMTQPGVFFSLDAPLVSIIGLYSNCGESLGWLDDQQYAFLQAQLERLKQKRAETGQVVVLAIHHFPRWFPTGKDPVSRRLDAICNSVGFWPDAVVAGHAHLYQRIIRDVAGKRIPYFVNGCGGYGVAPMEAVGRNYVKDLPKGDAVQINQEGFLRATVTKPAGKPAGLAFDYYSVKSPTPASVDHYEAELA